MKPPHYYNQVFFVPMMAALMEGRHDPRLAREHSSLLTQILIWHYYYYC